MLTALIRNAVALYYAARIRSLRARIARVRAESLAHIGEQRSYRQKALPALSLKLANLQLHQGLRCHSTGPLLGQIHRGQA